MPDSQDFITLLGAIVKKENGKDMNVKSKKEYRRLKFFRAAYSISARSATSATYPDRDLRQEDGQEHVL